VDDGYSSTSIVPKDVEELVQQRINAKENKDWALADMLRSQVSELGYTIKDVKNGQPIISLKT
jgi:cysteinyl-tRNA synthetase